MFSLVREELKAVQTGRVINCGQYKWLKYAFIIEHESLKAKIKLCPTGPYFWWFATEWMKNLSVPYGAPNWSNFWGFFLGAVNENSLTLKSFYNFWALDMGPTWAAPDLFFTGNKKVIKFNAISMLSNFNQVIHCELASSSACHLKSTYYLAESKTLTSVLSQTTWSSQ